MQHKTQKNQILFLLAVNHAVLFAAYGVFFRQHFATDTYFVWFSEDMNAKWVSTCGRPVAGLVYVLLRALGVNAAQTQWVGVLPLILLSGWACTALVGRILELVPEEKRQGWALIGLDVSVLLSAVNVYFVEWFYFVECALAMYAISFSCAVWAALESSRKGFGHRMAAFFLLMVSANAYQTGLGIFAMTSLLLLVLQSDFTPTGAAVGKSGFLLANMAGNAAVNLILPKILAAVGVLSSANSRIAGTITPGTIVGNAAAILYNQLRVWYAAYGLLPPAAMALAVLVFSALLILSLRQKKLGAKRIWFCVLCAAAGYACIWAPHLLTDGVSAPPRSIVGVFLIFTWLGVCAIALGMEEKNERLAAVLLSVFLFLNLGQIHRIASDIFETNRRDAEIARAVVNRVEEYENESGESVSAMSFIWDSKVSYGYEGIRYQTYNLCEKAFVPAWSQTQVIEQTCGRHFDSADMNWDIYHAYFAGRNWDKFVPEEQLVFDGGTLYICVY